MHTTGAIGNANRVSSDVTAKLFLQGFNKIHQSRSEVLLKITTKVQDFLDFPKNLAQTSSGN